MKHIKLPVLFYTEEYIKALEDYDKFGFGEPVEDHELLEVYFCTIDNFHQDENGIIISSGADKYIVKLKMSEFLERIKEL